MRDEIRGVSLFANVGIAETYLKNHNIKIVVANELIKKRADFYKELYPETNMIVGDINDEKIYKSILEDSIKKKCNFLLATPPCQGMSVAGKMKKDDPRNNLIIKVIEFIKELQPKNIIIENVPGILRTNIEYNSNEEKIVNFIERELNDYFVNYSIIDVADYETPQTRKRAIFLISKDRFWDFPKKSSKMTTVRDAIGHLPSLESGEKSDIPYHFAKKHNERHILWLKNTPTGKTAINNENFFPVKDNGERIRGYQTTYKRIDWDKPAPTITMANGSVSSQNNVHPGRLKEDGCYSDARVLTLKEIFILTGLPDNWTYPKWASENLVRQVIGEGIPPKLLDNLLKEIPA